MKKLIYATLAVMTVLSCTGRNPFFEEWDTPYGIPPFDQIEESHYLPALKAGIKAHEEEIQAIIDNPDAPDFENTVVALDRSGKLLSRVEGVMLNLVESDGTESLNAIVEEAMPLISEHSDNITMNPALFARIKAVYESPEMLERSREDQMLVKLFYEEFKSNGIDLPEDKQARLKEINSELSSLVLTFGNNILAESNAFKEKFGFSVANYYDKMATIEDRDLREQVFKGYSLRANNDNEYDNKANVLRIMELRIEKAGILGYDTPANQILHDKMAGNSKTVDEFLAGIMKACMERAREEIADMQKLMDEDIAAGLLPAGTRIQPWDYMYYAEKVRKARYNLDEAEVMQYFKMENVRKGVFDNASRLYGITFEPVEDVKLYNPECEAFKVSDADGSLIGVIITDYYPRSSKRAGAWMTNFVEQWVNAEGENIRPVIVNVGNFNKPDGEVPALLNIDQVETMFHEFGHALHGLLSQCTYSSLSGTAVKRDFVELPSQINENWAFQPEVLATYAFHYKTGEVIPASLVEKIQAASNFNQGFVCGELCAASILDMKWHELTSVEGVDVDTFEAEVAKQMGLVDEIIPRYRSTYFNHIFGTSGYSAGYYSYLWAEVLDKDAFQAFVEEGILNRETGMRFRSCILSRGGSEEPMTLYREFRGADPNPEFLLKGRGLK